MRRSESNSPAPMEGLPGTPHRNRRRGNTIPPPFHLFRPTSKRFPSRKLQSARMSCMKYRPITRILSLAAALFILTACTPHNLPDGWYTTSGEGPDTRIGPSIVTCSDFAALHLDSLPSGEGTFIYQITGTVKPEKQKRWTAATRKAHRLPLRRQRAGSTPHQHADRQGNLRHLRPRHLRRRRPDAGNLP